MRKVYSTTFSECCNLIKKIVEHASVEHCRYPYLDLVPLDFDGVKIGAYRCEFPQSHFPLLKPYQDFLENRMVNIQT